MTKLKRIARTILHDKNFFFFFHAFILLLITDNTCILLCTIYSIGPLNESNKERGMKHLCFSIFSRLCNQSIDRFRVIYLWRTKIKRTARLARDQQRRCRSQLVNLGNQVERAVHKFRHLP